MLICKSSMLKHVLDIISPTYAAKREPRSAAMGEKCVDKLSDQSTSAAAIQKVMIGAVGEISVLKKQPICC